MTKTPDGELKEKMANNVLTEVEKTLKQALPKGWGFIFFTFDYGSEGRLCYMSSEEVKDTIRLMKEFIAKNENI